MMTDILCARFEADGTIARYAAGTLVDEDGADFENHFLLCERCQASIRAATAMRRHFRDAPSSRRRLRRAPIAVGLAAASLAAIIAVRGFGTAESRRLGAVDEAPLYVGSAVRSDDAGAAALFDSAMVAYNRAEYRIALERFDRLHAVRREAVSEFFAGISHLMLGQAKSAERLLTRVIAEGETPYRGEALFYRAKARLQQGSRNGARSDLREAAASSSLIATEAADLLARLER